MEGFVIDQDFLQAFTDEAQEQLDRLNQGFLALEKDNENLEIVHEVFRAAHTLKGAASMMGFTDVARLTHEMEDFLELVRTGKVRLTSGRLDVLFSSLDLLQKLMAGIVAGRSADVDLEEIVARLTRLAELEEKISAPEQENLPDGRNFRWTDFDRAAARRVHDEGRQLFCIRIGLDPDLPMVSAYAFLIINELTPHGDLIRSVPALEELEGDTAPWLTLLLASAADESLLRQLIEKSGVVRSLEISMALPDNEESPEEDEGEVPGKDEAAAEKSRPAKSSTARDIRAEGQTSLRVEATRVDGLINLAGEIIMALSQYQELGQELRRSYGFSPAVRRHVETTQQLGRVCNELQEGAMSLRMVPMSRVFQRFPRLVRDVARQTGKEIRLVLEGEETELDKTMVDEIHEPLVHLVRNAIDHGIEMPEIREAAGKSREGTVILRARQAGSHILIEVEDDGKGMDPERLRQRAQEKGILSESEARTLDRAGCLDLIFRPGFSTAESVSDLSGRGVGMDAVKRSIERLKGQVGMETEEGRGSIARLHLPLTLAIIPALLVQVCRSCYAIPLAVTVELLRVFSDEIQSIDRVPVIRLRDRVVPLLDLRRQFSRSATALDGENTAGRNFVVIVQHRDRLVGLVVDRFDGEKNLVIKGLDPQYSRVPGVAGAAILGSGQVALILDVAELLETRPAVKELA